MKKEHFLIIAILVVVTSLIFLVINYNSFGFNDEDKNNDNNVDIVEGSVKVLDQVIVEEVVYFKGVEGYLARPVVEGEFPGLILIHEWWGLNDNIKKLSREYAKEGYVVLAVDLYEGEVTQDSSVAGKLAGNVRGDAESAFSNLESGIAYLKDREEIDVDNLGSVGWCFGGGWSYEMAKNDLGVDASVIYYGRFNPEDDLSIMRANILGHFGEDDSSIAVDDVKAFEVKLNTLSGDHQVFIYENSGHAFANEDSNAYVEGSAKLAFDRTKDFLNRELK